MIRAGGFRTTTEALWDLGVVTGPLGIVDYTVAVEGGLLVLASRRRAERLVELPIDRIRDVSVAETTDGTVYPQWALAIMITIPMPSRDVTLPIVPVDDLGRRLTWNDAEVWRLARELAHELDVPLVRPPVLGNS